MCSFVHGFQNPLYFQLRKGETGGRGLNKNNHLIHLLHRFQNSCVTAIVIKGLEPLNNRLDWALSFYYSTSRHNSRNGVPKSL